MRYRNNRTPKRGIQKEQKETDVTVKRLITNSETQKKKISNHNIRLQDMCKRL